MSHDDVDIIIERKSHEPDSTTLQDPELSD